MRPINRIIIHATASAFGVNQRVEDIRKMHMEKRGFLDIGYHFVVLQDGSIDEGRPVEQIGAHTTGNNADSIGIAYVGGLGRNGKPEDTRNESQKTGLQLIVNNLLKQFPTITEIKGHRDYSPDLDRDGIIERHEWIKSCPCFEVSEEFKIE